MLSEKQKKNIEARSRTLHAVRDFFWQNGYTEVETPVAVKLPGQEPFLFPVPVSITNDRGESFKFYLNTSPEYGMKKLLGAGFNKIYQITRSFRDRESFGGIHSPEFTMLEWYRSPATLFELMDETEQIIRHAGAALGITIPEIKRYTVAQLLEKYAGVDLEKNLDDKEIKKTSEALGFKSSEKAKYEDSFFNIFLNKVEPRIIEEGPVFIYKYPKALAALSTLDPQDNRYALRFELMWNGLELANAFQELLDPIEQKRRFEEEQEMKRDMNEEIVAIDEELLQALPNIKSPTSGIAMGIDRLVMALTNTNDIRDVLTFPY